MKAFKDNDGRDWKVEINVNTIKRVEALTGVKLMTVLDGQLLQDLKNDPCLLVNVAYAICKPDADAAGISDEQFGARMVGDALDMATNAILEDLIDFFPSSRRTVIRKALAKATAIEAEATRKAGEKIDQMDVGAIVQQALGGSSGSSPASSASIPAA